MANLALSAAPFNSDENIDEDIIQKKTRNKNSYNKTIKRTSQKVSQKVGDFLSAIHNNLDNSEEEDTLGDFNPPQKPVSSGVERTKREAHMSPNDPPVNLSSDLNNTNSSDKLNFDQITPEQTENTYEQQYPSQYSNQYGQLASNLSNATGVPNQYIYDKLQSGSVHESDPLLKKINYMIHLLEEQCDEKSNNVTEELILYCFLGVFMIFIVDSFARAGKYTR
jgi:hypothetical protein